MAYKHGVEIEELTTSMIPLVQISEPIVAIGTALKGTPNEAILIHSLAEYVETFGWHGDYSKYTLEEVADVAFNLYAVTPVIFINVYDPTGKHKVSSGSSTIEPEEPPPVEEEKTASMEVVTTSINERSSQFMVLQGENSNSPLWGRPDLQEDWTFFRYGEWVNIVMPGNMADKEKRYFGHVVGTDSDEVELPVSYSWGSFEDPKDGRVYIGWTSDEFVPCVVPDDYEGNGVENSDMRVAVRWMEETATHTVTCANMGTVPEDIDWPSTLWTLYDTEDGSRIAISTAARQGLDKVLTASDEELVSDTDYTLSTITDATLLTIKSSAKVKEGLKIIWKEVR